MCFIVSFTKRYEQPKIARRDIPCYKVLAWENDDEACAVIYPFRYKVGEIQDRVEIDPIFYTEHAKINRGYHSYKKDKPFRGCNALFVIPKGTKYWANKEEYVSERIKLVRSLSWKRNLKAESL